MLKRIEVGAENAITFEARGDPVRAEAGGPIRFRGEDAEERRPGGVDIFNFFLLVNPSRNDYSNTTTCRVFRGDTIAG